MCLQISQEWRALGWSPPDNLLFTNLLAYIQWANSSSRIPQSMAGELNEILQAVVES